MSNNFAISAVVTAPSPATSGTSVTVTAGHGSRFYVGKASVWPSGSTPTPANAEVVSITSISTDTLTITRAVESSTARTIVVGDVVAQGVTAAMYDALVTADAARLVAANNLSDVASAATARTNLGLGTAATQASSAFATPASVTSAIAAQNATDTGTFAPIAGSSTYATQTQTAPLVGSDAWLKLHAAGNLDALVVGAITRDANGAATSAGVVWPDGTTGTFTATTVNSTFLGAVDAFTVTYVGGTTKTVTQSAVTRDSTTGAITTRPAMTVA